MGGAASARRQMTVVSITGIVYRMAGSHVTTDVKRLDREAPLPAEMQGRWVDVDDAATELFVSGGEVTCFGQLVHYDYKEIVRIDGALTVDLKVSDPSRKDSFERANVTGLVITPEGEFHAYNVKFGSQFVRNDHS